MGKEKPVFFVLLLAWLFALFWFRPWDSLKDYTIGRQGQADSSTMVYGTVSVEQSFTVDGIFDAVDIYVDNYDHTYEGTFTARIFDGDGRCIYGRDIGKADLGSRWLELHLDSLPPGPDTYRIEITAPELNKDNCVLVYHSDTQTYKDGEMRINGKLRDKSACFSVYRRKANPFAYLALLLFLVSAAAWWFNRKSLMGASVCLLAGMGLCMLVVMAPMSQPDEDYHYNSALVLSNIMMGKSNLYEFPYEYRDFDGLVIHCNANSAYIRVMQDFFGGNGKEQAAVSFNGRRMDRFYYPMVYLAPAFGITLGRLLGFNFIVTHYLGRFFNLLLYIALSLAAIKIVPRKKEMMLSVTALPMCLHQAASYSYDVVINGLSFLLVAYILKLAEQEKEVTWKDALALMAIGGALCPNKLVYSALMLLVFMVPKEKFRGRLDRRRKLGAILLAVSIIVICSQFPTLAKILDGTINPDSEIARYYTVQFALSHPVKYVRAIYNTFALFGVSWFKAGSIGISLAGLTLPVPEYLISGFFVLMVLGRFHKGGEGDTLALSTAQKIICGLAAAVGTGLVVVALSMANLYGVDVFLGIQGRYFIPFLMPVMLCMGTDKVRVDIDGRRLACVYWFLWAGVLNAVLSSVAF